MTILLFVAVIGVVFLIFGEFALSREPKRSEEHRALVLKLRQKIAQKRNRPRVQLIYK